MKTPVAFFIFNRPGTTQKVFESIRKAKPTTLLVIADGPRVDRLGEQDICNETRATLNSVDWDCEVLTNYSNINLGCKDRITSGLNWVFSIVDKAIILEDDCLPHPSFFRFCEELLDYYQYDTRIMHIGGNNFNISGRSKSDSYYFLRATPIWGWATWRRAWQYFDINMNLWPIIIQEDRLADIVGSEEEAIIRYQYWDKAYQGIVSAWSYQWHFSCLCQGAYSVIPNINLVSNIGFGQDGTNTIGKSSPLANLSADRMTFPLIHPKLVINDGYAYSLYFNLVYKGRSKHSPIQRHIKQIGKLNRKLVAFVSGLTKQ